MTVPVTSQVVRSERGQSPRQFSGEVSEGATEAPSDDLGSR